MHALKTLLAFFILLFSGRPLNNISAEIETEILTKIRQKINAQVPLTQDEEATFYSLSADKSLSPEGRQLLQFIEADLKRLA